MRELFINGVRIADDTPAFVIAEIGHNHGGDLQTAMWLFKAAADAGATAVKLQKRANRTLFTKALFDQPYVNDNSYGATYGLHREALEFGRSEYKELQAYARELGLVFFATAFDFESADFLADIDVPAFKVASGDLKNVPLLRYVASLGKPMIVSTGAGTMTDVHRAYDEVMAVNTQLALLQCTCEYPALFAHLDLNVITTYRHEFIRNVIGYSGHDNGIAMPVAAYVLGARIVEKHFTLNRTMRGTDHKFSLEPQGMQKMVRDLGRVREALGSSVKHVYAEERGPAMKMGKAIVASRPIAKGEAFTAANLALKSPASALNEPYQLHDFIGRVASRDFAEGDVVV